MNVNSVPIWVRVMELDLKYWGQNTLIKIDSLLGKPIKTDRAVAIRELLHYARILIEVDIEDELTDTISFENEWGGIQHYLVQYEWKPLKCSNRQIYGH